MHGIALINNKELKVKIIDNNYNNHASEVEILEGVWLGRRVIVENKNLTIIKVKTYKELINFIKNSIGNIDLSENHFCEFIDNYIYNVIKNFSKDYTLSNTEYYNLLHTSDYGECKSKEEVKTYIMIDSIQSTLQGIKSSFTSVKRKVLIQNKL
ncbi:hypothetical protein FKF97_10155 [Clostridium perfringens]|nr:hypothetical protein [Clostridium perfringens]